MHFVYNGDDGSRQPSVSMNNDLHPPLNTLPPLDNVVHDAQPSNASTNTITIDMNESPASTVENEGHSAMHSSAAKFSHRNFNHRKFSYHDRRESPRDTLQKVLSVVVDKIDEEMKRDRVPIPEPQIYAASEYQSEHKMDMVPGTSQSRLGNDMDVQSETSWVSGQMYGAGTGVHAQITAKDFNHFHFNQPRGRHVMKKSRWRSEGHLKGPSNIMFVAAVQTKKDSMYEDDGGYRDSMYEVGDGRPRQQTTTTSHGSRLSGDV